MFDGERIGLQDLPEEVFASAISSSPSLVGTTPLEFQNQKPPERMVSLGAPKCSAEEDSERGQLLSTLEANRWVVSRAAKVLGISRSTLHRKIKKYSLN